MMPTKSLSAVVLHLLQQTCVTKTVLRLQVITQAEHQPHIRQTRLQVFQQTMLQALFVEQLLLTL